MAEQFDEIREETDFYFGSPPVEEVALGIHFRAPAELQSPHLSLFWERHRKEYPKIEEHPAVPQLVEPIDSMPAQATSIIFNGPLFRLLRISSVDGSLMLQIQRDMLGANWLRTTDDAVYPGFAFMYERFAAAWHDLLNFMHDLGADPPAPLQVEIAYIDAVPRGEGWNDFGDLSSLIAPWSGAFAAPLPSPEVVLTKFSCRIPHGRLHVTASPWTRPRDKRETLVISTLTRVRVNDKENPFDRLKEAHDWARKAFLGVTTETARNMWRRSR